MTLTAGALLNGRYEIIRCIKSGGMGSVFEAKDLRLANTVCAVKEILESALQGPDADYIRQTFEKEMEALAQLEHTAIPRVRDYFQEGDKSYIVMDFVRGQNLHDEIAACKKDAGVGLPARQAVEDILTLLEVVEYLHSQQPPVLHRDIKPANILRDQKTGRIKLVDFGLAKVLGSMSTPQTQVGTMGYCALEQISGQAETRSDLFSVGATLYHMLTGTAPVPNFSDCLVLNMPHLAPGLDAVVERATAVQPSRRYARAADFAADLKAWLNSESQGTTVVPAPRPVPAQPAPLMAPPPPMAFSPLADESGVPSTIQPFSTSSRLAGGMAVGAVLFTSIIGVGALSRWSRPAPSPSPLAVVETSSTPNPETLALLEQDKLYKAKQEKKRQEALAQEEKRAQAERERLERIKAARLRPSDPPARPSARHLPAERPRLDDGSAIPRGSRVTRDFRPSERLPESEHPSTNSPPGERLPDRETRTTGGHTETVTFFPFNVQLLRQIGGDNPALGQYLNGKVGGPENWQPFPGVPMLRPGKPVPMHGPGISGGYQIFVECNGIMKVTIRPAIQPGENYDWEGLGAVFSRMCKTHLGGR